MSDRQQDRAESSALIVPLAPGHEQAWQALYRAYGVFYRAPIADDALAATWRWLLDPRHPLEGLVAVDERGLAVGLAHFRASPEPMLGCDAGVLDDLYVDPAVRRRGVGRRLIVAVADIGRARGWPLVRWITAPGNAVARSVYDLLAAPTDWLTYEVRLQRAASPNDPPEPRVGWER
jgi:GNAT superfamily N-acetyltransferase